MSWSKTLANIGRSLFVAALAASSLVPQRPSSHPQVGGSLIAFRFAATTPNPHSQLGRDSIYVVSPDGGDATEILSGIYTAYDPFDIRWVPGKRIPARADPGGLRIGDSTTNVISPMTSYFALIIAFFQRY